MPDLQQNYVAWNEQYQWEQQGEEWSQAWGGSESQWYGCLFPRIYSFLPVQTILNSDGTMQLLWTRLTDGRASVWKLSSSGGFVSAWGYQTNGWAASALFLESGKTYELRLTLTDPDGGSATQTVTAITRTELQPDPAGRQLYVIPGSGGGDGSIGNPFQGLQTAADNAQPGDIFHVAAGTYAPFQLLTSGTPGHPIVFQGPGNGSAIVDGNGTNRGIVTLGEYNQTIAYVIIEELIIQNGLWGIDAQNSHDIVIRRNVIRDVDFGIYNRRANALEGNQTICDNVITGRTTWPGSGIPPERGIDLRGYGNVVCHNTVQNFGDCISVQPFTGSSFGNDIYGNDSSYCVDDGIEIDSNQANVRVWRNRVMNARMGVSVQPIRGGPAYIFRNEFFNLESTPIKMHNQTTGFYVMHNTGAKHGNGHGDNGAMWRNAVFRNNLFLGTEYAFEFTTVADEGFRDFDYNAWGTTRASVPYFKWDNIRYDTLADLPSGVEDHGVEAAFGHLMNATLPAAWDQPAAPGSRDLRLVAGVPEINAGTNISNLNDAFLLSGAPDMGAFEYGQPLPQYGPRTPQIVYLLWTRSTDGRTSVWTLNASGSFVSAKSYQAAGWTAESYQRNTNNTAQLLWTRASDGRASVWMLNAGGGYQSARGYQAAGWQATSSYRTSDGSAYLLWTRASDGRTSVWKLNASGGFQSAWGYQASGWQATSFHPGGDGSCYLVWTRASDGRASVWRLNASGVFQSAWGYQASGWQATSLHRNGDGTFFLLWTRASDGRASVWKLSSSGGFVSAWGYQANGWTAQSVYGQTDSSSYRQEGSVLVVRKAGTGNGTILTDQQACDAACAELSVPYIEGAMATLQVVPEANSTFVRWETADGIPLESIYYAQPGETVIAVFEKK
jgi:hypothetical protein